MQLRRQRTRWPGHFIGLEWGKTFATSANVVTFVKEKNTMRHHKSPLVPIPVI